MTLDTAINNELKTRFADLIYNMEPEVLSCDGELSRGQVRAKMRKLMGKWEQLEVLAGRRVSRDEAYEWSLAENDLPANANCDNVTENDEQQAVAV